MDNQKWEIKAIVKNGFLEKNPNITLLKIKEVI